MEIPSLEPYPYDPDEANRLLDEAGWVDSNGDGTRDKDGTELVLRYIANQRQLRKDVQAVVQQMWAQVGIGAELVNYGDDFFNGYADGGPQARVNTILPSIPAPAPSLTRRLLSTGCARKWSARTTRMAATGRATATRTWMRCLTSKRLKLTPKPQGTLLPNRADHAR